MEDKTGDKIIVLDFGSQYAHLICRRIRELGVYSELLPYDTTAGAIAEMKPKGIILSGGPMSVYETGAPTCDPNIFGLNGTPILGICYGMQLISHVFGGKVGRARNKEYGKAELSMDANSKLLEGVEKNGGQVWMSHGDFVEEMPEGFRKLAHTENSPVAAMEKGAVFGLQFHPEVLHTLAGRRILGNFVFGICGCGKSWDLGDFAELQVAELKKRVGNEGNSICALSGGVDSATAAVIAHRAIGERLTCIYVDTGLMRKNETGQIRDIFGKSFGMNLKIVDASGRFLKKLAGIRDPEEKRKVIGEQFIRVFEEEAKGAGFLIQGTIYPDRIESAATSRAAARIKTHHNVGGLPEDMKLKVVEPLRDLYKDEVRIVARALGLPSEIVDRLPFPGPGLAVRVIGEVTAEKLGICRDASAIVEEETRKAGISAWQAFAVVGDDMATGVFGDERKLGHIVTIRVVESSEAMTADWSRLPHPVLELMSSRITNEVPGVTWVAYAISSKPPSTIEPC